MYDLEMNRISRRLSVGFYVLLCCHTILAVPIKVVQTNQEVIIHKVTPSNSNVGLEKLYILNCKSKIRSWLQKLLC